MTGALAAVSAERVAKMSALQINEIEQRIFLLRGQRVILSADLADLYEVEPRMLVQAVKRNIERFPEDFIFQLTSEEHENLKSHFVISSWGGARRATPYAFTEQGVAMLSGVLHSKRAVADSNRAFAFAHRSTFPEHVVSGAWCFDSVEKCSGGLYPIGIVEDIMLRTALSRQISICS